MNEVVYLNSEETVGIANPKEFVDIVRAAYKARGKGAPTKPRVSLRSEKPPGLLNSYSVILPELGVMGGTVYSLGFASSDAQLLTVLFDSESGAALALIDSASMNPYKTGAVGAVGIDALARTSSQTIGLFGTGAQARGQLLASLTVRDINQVNVFSPTRKHRLSFASEMSELTKKNVVAVEGHEEAVQNADIIITATTSTKPVFNGDHVQPGTHINAIGQYNPKYRELDTKTVQRAKYVPDLRKRALLDSGELLVPLKEGAVTEDHIYAELGDIVANRIPGRENDEEITLFDSGGTAIETVASAALLYRKSLAQGLGTSVQIGTASEFYTGKRGSSTDDVLGLEDGG